MLACKKIFGQFYVISRPHINRTEPIKCYRFSQAYLSTGVDGEEDKRRYDPNKNEKARSPADSCEFFTKPDKSQTPTNLSAETQADEKKSDIGGNAKKIFAFVGSVIAAYLMYKNWFLTNNQETPPPAESNKKRKSVKAFGFIKDPPNSDDIPSKAEYLLIGGGTASFSAFRAIKSRDPKAKVLVIAKEPFNPYMRPPLSKEMFYTEDRQAANELRFKQWNGVERSLYFEPEAFYIASKELTDSENGGVAVARGWSVKNIDVDSKTVTLDDGKTVKYDKCLLATGGKPKELPFSHNLTDAVKEKVTVYRGILDFKEVEDLFANSSPSSVAIIGGGFLGSELSISLARRGEAQGVKVTQIMRGSGPLIKVLPPYLSKWTALKLMNEGVNVVTNSEVENILEEEGRLRIVLNNNNNSVLADHVIVAIGIEPNTSFPESAGLEVDKIRGGYVVNSEMLARSDLYVAGDNASFYDVKLGIRRREEHHDHAVVTGRVAGENMSGKASYFNHQSMFWSEIGSEIGFEAIGIVDSSLPTVAVFAKPEEPTTNGDEYNKGVIFYLKDDVLVGVLLWNLFNKISVARQLLKQNKNYHDLNDVAKLFSIHGEDSKNRT